MSIADLGSTVIPTLHVGSIDIVGNGSNVSLDTIIQTQITGAASGPWGTTAFPVTLNLFRIGNMVTFSMLGFGDTGTATTGSAFIQFTFVLPIQFRPTANIIMPLSFYTTGPLGPPGTLAILPDGSINLSSTSITTPAPYSAFAGGAGQVYRINGEHFSYVI